MSGLDLTEYSPCLLFRCSLTVSLLFLVFDGQQVIAASPSVICHNHRTKKGNK